MPSPHLPSSVVEKIDLVVCTWNRAHQLKATLDSVTRLVVPYQCQLRIIVVDNNSTDGTAEVLDDFAKEKFFDRHRFLRLREIRQGHTYARNTAIEHADSDLMLWTDDDVIVDPFWVKSMVEFANAARDIAFFGGPIIAELRPACPEWVSQNWDVLKGCFADRQLGDERMVFSVDRLPYGANFAVRTPLQVQFPFDVELGRRGDQVMGEDELDVMRRWIAAGYKGCWVPDAKVVHVIDSPRITPEYVRQYFLGQGRVLVKKQQSWKMSMRRLWWTAVGQYLMFRFTMKFANSQQWLAHLIRSGLAEGQYRELENGPPN
jgi:glycosyltransferase involved in cell wall biosynthesis